MIQIHYDNPRLMSSRKRIGYMFFDLIFVTFWLDRHDSSGIRFYIGDKLRENDLGFLTFGTGASPSSIALPPQVERFSIDSFCPSFATQVSINLCYVTIIRIVFRIFLEPESMWFTHYHIHICKVLVFGQKSFEMIQRSIISSMLNRTISIINFNIDYHNRFDFSR